VLECVLCFSPLSAAGSPLDSGTASSLRFPSSNPFSVGRSSNPPPPSISRTGAAFLPVHGWSLRSRAGPPPLNRRPLFSYSLFPCFLPLLIIARPLPQFQALPPAERQLMPLSSCRSGPPCAYAHTLAPFANVSSLLAVFGRPLFFMILGMVAVALPRCAVVSPPSRLGNQYTALDS